MTLTRWKERMSMTNNEEYKTDKEQSEAFKKFCLENEVYQNCLCNKICSSECSYIWIEIDTEELEKEQKLEEEKGEKHD